jgi:hypothetical protein
MTIEIEKMLRVSITHIPNLDDDIDPWCFCTFCPESTWTNMKMAFVNVGHIYNYEQPPPGWLLDICRYAHELGCDWLIFDSDADPLPGFKIYRNP